MVKLEGEDWVMNSSQLVMVRDNEVNLSELSVAKLNLSECGLVGGGDSCKLCTTIDYWVEGPVILVVCLAGILGHHTTLPTGSIKILSGRLLHAKNILILSLESLKLPLFILSNTTKI